MSQQRLRELIDKLLANDCSQEEKQELYRLVETLEDAPQLQQVLEDAWMRYEHPSHTVPATTSAMMLQNILQPPPALPMRNRFRWAYLAAAAVVLLLLGLGIYRYLLYSKQTSVQSPLAASTHDVHAPDKSRATLTLANGQQIQLDQAAAGPLATENGARVVWQGNGQLVYEKTSQPVNEKPAYNTLNNPRGSRVISLMLPDGTKVWLNAGSSLTYPAVFESSERKVAVTGEAYFEVAHNPSRPFIVSVHPSGGANDGGLQVNVLGTHFNIRAYDDEASAKVTLLQGKVRLTRSTEQVMLQPGEQVIAPSHSPLTIDHSPHLEQVMAWKEGLFDYKSSDITEVLRDAARWYDIQVIYEGKKPADTFTGGIDRTATLSELLTILQMTGVHFRLEGKKLTVLNGR